VSYRPITDVWILARPKVKYYGAYPNGFLERARALLGVSPLDAVLHVCGGRARQYPAKPRGFGPFDKTLDLDASLEPDYLQAATDPLPPGHPYADGLWPALIADPPYTEADADQYAPGRAAFPSANLILRNMLAVVRPGGRVGMLHYVLPQPPKKGVRFVACVGVIVGYNNRMRVLSVFEREVESARADDAVRLSFELPIASTRA
jgi:hypothetical protein